MWWYYKCVNLIKVLIQGSKVILFSIENALQKPAGQAGLRPVPTLWLDQPPLGMSKKTDCLKTTRERRALFSLPSCNSLALLNSARSNARKADLEAGPPDSLSTKPTIGGGLRLCQSRNGATKSTIAEESFPRWRHAAISSLHTRTTEGVRAEHVTPETKNSRGKTNQLRACFKTHPSKYKLNS